MEQRGPYYDALRANHRDDLRSLLATERDRTMRFRDQLAEERGKSYALKIALDNMTKAYEKACRDIDDLKVDNGHLLDRICKVQDNHIFAYVELFSATGQSSHRDALNWIKIAASVVPGCVDSTKEKIAALSENEELKRKVAELKTKVDNQQEELLDCKADVNFTKDSRDYWRGACLKLTRAIGIDAINDAVEWIKNAADKIADLSKQLILAKEGLKQAEERLSLKHREIINVFTEVVELRTKVMNQAKDLASAKCDLTAKTIYHNSIDWQGNALILATGNYSYDHALDWIKRHRSNDEANSLLGDKV